MNFLRFLFSKVFFKQLTIAFFTIIILVYLLLIFLKLITNHNKLKEVPNLTGLSLINLEEILDNHDLRFEIIDSSKFNNILDPLSVIEHSPSAGQLVKKNRKIYITLNPSGFRKISVPDVIQITKRNAEAKIKSIGFLVGEIIYKKSIGKDMVLEIRHNGEEIKPGMMLEKASKIDLVLGDGKAN